MTTHLAQPPMCHAWLLTTVLTQRASTRAFCAQLIDLLSSTMHKHQSFLTELHQPFLLLQSMMLTQHVYIRTFRVQLIVLLNSMTRKHQSFSCPPGQSSKLNDAQASELLK